MSVDQFFLNFRPNALDKLTTLYFRIKGAKIARSAFVLYRAKLVRFVKNIEICQGSVIKSGAEICSCNKSAQILIGSGVTVGSYSFIYSSSKIQIGDHSLIAPFTYIVDSNHGIAPDVRIRNQPNKVGPIKIGKDVWVGAHSLVLAGVSIGNGSIIAANSLVNCDVPDNEIWGGSPAVFLRKR